MPRFAAMVRARESAPAPPGADIECSPPPYPRRIESGVTVTHGKDGATAARSRTPVPAAGINVAPHSDRRTPFNGPCGSPFRALGAFALLGAAVLALAAAAAEDRTLADFEGDTYPPGWTVTGEAFGPAPARGTLAGQMPVGGFKGRGLVNTFFRGDGATGTLTSPEFRLDRRYLAYLIGGGYDEERLALQLLVEGKVVRSATGPNRVPGGSEQLEPGFWDLADLAGKTARIRIVDQATGGWGHLNVDELILTDRKPAMDIRNARREITAERRYLILPVKTGAPKRRMAVLDGGTPVREFDIELSAEPDFEVFLDLAPFRGKTLTLQVDRLPEGAAALEQVRQDDSVPGADVLYQEKLRPQVHFSSRRGWNNDPNGLVYSAGEYHLFYQHNPYGWDWGNMHWGHAVSRDLVHWQELPIALYPHAYGDMAFSGSAVVDRANTSGWKSGQEDLLVLAYTSTGRGECIAYSNDRGRTWTEYEGNPVVRHQGRDPRLLWHEGTRQWVMALYDEGKEDGKDRRSIDFYTSPDLKHWTRQGRIDGFFECPDLFELPVEGKAGQSKWVLLAADGNYALGQFDGRRFIPDPPSALALRDQPTPKLRGNYGNCFYAAQTWSDTPDGRRVQIGWGQVKLPGMPFNQMMLAPCELSLRATPDGVRMAYKPVRELEKLRGPAARLRNQEVREGENPLSRLEGDLWDLELELRPGAARQVGLTVRGIPITYDPASGQLSCAGREAPVRLTDGRLKLRVLVDRASLEIFAEDGLVYMPLAVLPKEEDRSLALFTRGAPARIVNFRAYPLRSIWQR